MAANCKEDPLLIWDLLDMLTVKPPIFGVVKIGDHTSNCISLKDLSIPIQ